MSLIALLASLTRSHKRIVADERTRPCNAAHRGCKFCQLCESWCDVLRHARGLLRPVAMNATTGTSAARASRTGVIKLTAGAKVAITAGAGQRIQPLAPALYTAGMVRSRSPQVQVELERCPPPLARLLRSHQGVVRRTLQKLVRSGSKALRTTQELVRCNSPKTRVLRLPPELTQGTSHLASTPRTPHRWCNATLWTPPQMKVQRPQQ